MTSGLLNRGRFCLDAALTRKRQRRPFASATLITALDKAWATIRAHHREIPPAVIVVAGSTTGNSRSSGLVLGHFAALRWQHDNRRLSEVLVSGEGLRRPAADVFTTLLHEAAHALAFARGIKDTSRQGRWHNKRFAELASELGLDTTKDDKIGYSPSTLREDTATRYQAVITDLAAALTGYRDPEPTPGSKPKNPTSVAAICDCPRRIRVSVTVLEEGPITCGLCDAEFVADQ